MSKICHKAVSFINQTCRAPSFLSEIESLLVIGNLHSAINLALSHPVHFHHPPYIKLLQLCIDKNEYNQARLLHHHLYASRFQKNVHINTKLVILYSKSGDMKDARQVFDGMSERSVVSWTALLSGYSQNGYDEEAVKVFVGMRREGVKGNQFTYGSVLSACTRLGCLDYGMQIQGCVQKSRFIDNLFLQCALVALHSKCGKMADACYVFDLMSNKDLVSWNSMVSGFAGRGFSNDAIVMFRLMLRDGMSPDNFTLASILMACAKAKDLLNVCQLHGFVLKSGFGSYNSLNGSLINAYAKSGSVKSADQIYKCMSEKDVISCTALITGYAHEGSNSIDAVKLFSELRQLVMNLDNVILCSMVNICANMASLGLGRQIHALSLKCLACHDIPMSNALIDMYSKCGEIIDGCHVFDEMKEKNVISWTSLIDAYGKHGYGYNAIALYQKMVDQGLEPNDITFLSLLFSCSHSGLTAQGQECFDSMVSKYNIVPQAKHYSCMVDLLARGGKIEEAYHLIHNMHMKPNASVWGAILGACSAYGNVAIGKVAARHLFDLDPGNPVNYVVMASIYAAAGMWDGAQDTRNLMEVNNLKKQSGLSFSQSTSKRLLPP
uniref:pentatricopeptide repeat-containing protein At3g20730 n=1 Tax=Erigeron canadensis TaxID=72917 RepID=UPI001CB94187|nr:pentatricopeptide repeat-containing protein At3g20730 [Erigeron canadensis]